MKAKVSRATARKRRRKLAEFLEALPAKKFCYHEMVLEAKNGCGTLCCAAGWMPKVDAVNWQWYQTPSTWYGENLTLPRLRKRPRADLLLALAAYFGLDKSTAQIVFYRVGLLISDDAYIGHSDSTVSAYHVAAALRYLLTHDEFPRGAVLPLMPRGRRAVSRWVRMHCGR